MKVVWLYKGVYCSHWFGSAVEHQIEQNLEDHVYGVHAITNYVFVTRDVRRILRYPSVCILSPAEKTS